MKHWMFSCEEVSKKASASLDLSLPLGQRVFMWMHFLMCRYCLRFYRQLHMMRRFCQQEETSSKDADANLSPAAKERIKQAIRKCKR